MRTARSVRRRARLLFHTSPSTPRPAAHPSRPVRDGALAGAAGLLLAGTLGGPTGLALGTAGAWGAWRWLRRRGTERARKVALASAHATRARVPLVAELLAACLAAGSGPAQGAEAVGRSVGGPLGEGLVHAALALRLGEEPATVWKRFAAQPGCAVLAHCMERAGCGGVPAIRDISRVARQSRALRARAAAESARRTAVLVTGPLGLCFLPAFLALGVAPVLLGLARSLL
jgi:Flp pilus assembly protein TadB